jgi:hypothetical protein
MAGLRETPGPLLTGRLTKFTQGDPAFDFVFGTEVYSRDSVQLNSRLMNRVGPFRI